MDPIEHGCRIDEDAVAKGVAQSDSLALQSYACMGFAGYSWLLLPSSMVASSLASKVDRASRSPTAAGMVRGKSGVSLDSCNHKRVDYLEKNSSIAID